MSEPPRLHGVASYRCPNRCGRFDGYWVTKTQDGDGMPPPLHEGDDRCFECGAEGEWVPDHAEAWKEFHL